MEKLIPGMLRAGGTDLYSDFPRIGCKRHELINMQVIAFLYARSNPQN
jgi:hypothetical protein